MSASEACKDVPRSGAQRMQAGARPSPRAARPSFPRPSVSSLLSTFEELTHSSREQRPPRTPRLSAYRRPEKHGRARRSRAPTGARECAPWRPWRTRPSRALFALTAAAIASRLPFSPDSALSSMQAPDASCVCGAALPPQHAAPPGPRCGALLCSTKPSRCGARRSVHFERVHGCKRVLRGLRALLRCRLCAVLLHARKSSISGSSRVTPARADGGTLSRQCNGARRASDVEAAAAASSSRAQLTLHGLPSPAVACSPR
ncbi:hypothetical protein FA09DRAFT_117160 [Tilletiopsis washingtonensis]|jgi:hypothetical protein|uniref:Uncharacterized protein n=1 Tax=Tilletiopsis washingtonensis TaxID=58919 RepID=A0A316ZH78_9BASI|nr:hypothetical protein FA09DRAFT_117160 [Tilletiopsis washingtonensis]PWO00872.1 hypothetical protein FA09DRAFT_117160 [Tilletiopsis washingtonensis]